MARFAYLGSPLQVAVNLRGTPRQTMDDFAIALTHRARPLPNASPLRYEAPVNMTDKDTRPFLMLTAVLDAGARPAALTRSHGEAYERALAASYGHDTAGLDLVELTIASPAFVALRKHLKLPEDLVGLYDVFPLASHLEPTVRQVAGQFLAAEAVWTLDEQGQLGGVPINVKLDLPKDWDHAPAKIHERLVGAGALELSHDAIETFRAIKEAWDSSNPS